MRRAEHRVGVDRPQRRIDRAQQGGKRAFVVRLGGEATTQFGVLGDDRRRHLAENCCAWVRP